MISFQEAVALNLAMDPTEGESPDFILTIAGEDVGKLEIVNELELLDDEEGMSEITVKLVNPEMRYSDRFKKGQEVELRLGYRGQLGEKVSLPIEELTRDYPESGESTIEIKARDESSKMSGGSNKGNHSEGDDLRVMNKEAGARGLKVNAQGVSGTSHKKPYVMNERSTEIAWKFGRNLKVDGYESGGVGAGEGNPSSPLGGEKDSSAEGTNMRRDKGHTHSSAEGFSQNAAKGRDENRSNNHGNSHGQEPVTADLDLRGFPTLRSKRNVKMVGYGEEDSGIYYVKKAHHSLKIGQGYRTKAHLIRGGTGKGGVGGKPPVVMYADIWKKGTLFLGPRQTQEDPDVTFSRHESKHVIGFKVHIKPQPHRGGGEPNKGEGEGIDLRNRAKPIKTGGPGGKNQDAGSQPPGAGSTAMT